MGAVDAGDHGYRPKTLARYLRLCTRMAGYRGDDEIDFDDAVGIASFMVMTGHAPPVSAWIDGLAERAAAEANGAWAEAFF